MPVPVSLEEAKRRIFEKHGNKIEILEYTFWKYSAKMKCNVCGNTWDTPCCSSYAKHGCKNCYRINLSENHPNRLKYEDIKSFIEEQGCKLISTEYIKKKSKLEILFECGHVHEISFDSFKRGARCPCIHINRYIEKSDEKRMGKILNILEKHSFTFVKLEPSQSRKGGKNRYFSFICDKGHLNEHRNITAFVRDETCTTCTLINASVSQIGSGGNNWKGGITKFKAKISATLKKWRNDSRKSCGRKCVITGDEKYEIHHLYPANKILEEVLNELDVERYKLVGDYPEEVINEICEKYKKKHREHPLGVCLRKDVHYIFHRTYGNDCTPENFYEFQDKIKKGEIVIPSPQP